MDKSDKWRLIWPVMVIMVLHFVAIFLFTRGFLLTRTELPFYSTCSDSASQSPCEGGFNSTTGCWTKPLVQRVVIIVIDALRFDFVAPSTCFQEKKPWMDRLKVLQDLALTQPSRARIFKFIADPPTTTLQRLKGLTTGGLPTFIDVGHSFGAPAIVEDNFVHQLVQNGRKVVMMGDDTWMQLFPHHFEKSYPFPSFNVKDLHTVDNGCIDHLIPLLHHDDWDVLIAHFLGVDHAGHIYGVDSGPMVEKLDQYNGVLERVIGILEDHSGPGGLHENTLLLVLGDHGQTLNGDHGGGTAEEAETSLFAMTFDKVHSARTDPSSSDLHLDKMVCQSSIQQLNFAVTVSALLGIPFPFGSIGTAEPELYALVAGVEGLNRSSFKNCENESDLEEWMKNYATVLCKNSWQVKKYVDVYSAASVDGFSSEDMIHITDEYAQAQQNWSQTVKILQSHDNKNCHTSLPALKGQIDAYSRFLDGVAELARSKWTEFNVKMMGAGLGAMFISLVFHFLSIKRVMDFSPCGASKISLGSVFAFSTVLIRGCSFLSNSYILEEGKVANYLLATSCILQLRYSFKKNMMLSEAVILLLLTLALRFSIEIGLSKQAATSLFMNYYPSWLSWFTGDHPFWTLLSVYMPILALLLVAYLIHKSSFGFTWWGISNYVIKLTILSYMLIVVHTILESNVLGLPPASEYYRRVVIPQTIYALGLGKLLLLAIDAFRREGKVLDCYMSLYRKTVMVLCAWSPTIILLSGSKGSLFALALIISGKCMMRLKIAVEDSKGTSDGLLSSCLSQVTQWNLLAVCLFFATGHWCAFDGLRYGAAFIGFDEFIFARQAALQAIETFGFSHILPILGLPFLVADGNSDQGRPFLLFKKISLAYLILGMISAVTVTFTLMCVSIHRRHLMVWGLFAPKYVFDVVGLIVTDTLICMASIYYVTCGR
uniref:GPI ethanolamine phosphate transferase 3 n=1 Tax=Kalanchoe fedtschenkoi TaxID=63787 RepID=A0A7N0ZXE6_KALFE